MAKMPKPVFFPATFSVFLFLLLSSQSNPPPVKSTESIPKGSSKHVSTAPLIEKNILKARETQQTIIHIRRSGMYSIQVKSEQGVRLEIMDLMAGPFMENGETGSMDGRIDALLTEGKYKILLHCPKEGRGEAVLSVLPYREASGETDIRNLPRLQPLALVSSSLKDLEQQSYWLHVKKRQNLRLEAIGRSLSNCRIFKEGSWLEDIVPSVSVFEPEAGRPMTYIEFFHDINPGLYLITLYGGSTRKWSNEADESPCHIRLGIPFIGENGQHLHTISPFGRDVFQAGEHSDFFQLVRQDKRFTTLVIRSEKNLQSRFGKGNTAAITKESRDPWCSINDFTHGEKKWVIISGRPGDPVELDFFKQVHHYSFPGKRNEYWISSIHSAESRDALDVTAVLTHPQLKTPIQSLALHVSSENPLIRRVNLLGDNSVFLYLEESGKYIIEEDQNTGGKGSYQIKPFMVHYPPEFREPEFQDPGSDFFLTAGYHILSISPRSQGILQFVLHKKDGWAKNLWQNLTGEDPHETPPESAPKCLLWPAVTLDAPREEGYDLWLNHISGVESGVIVRKLPLNLEDPLPLILQPGQKVPVKIEITRRSRLIFTGDSLEIRNNGHSFLNGSEINPGVYILEARNLGKKSGTFNLKTEAVDTTPPPKPEIKRVSEIFPTLTETAPVFADFERTQQKQFYMKVDKPGLYRLETSGRMATAIFVRTSFSTSLFSAGQNGIGRNALIQEYLKPGEYLVSVQTRGLSKGRAGIHLRRTRMREGGELLPGIISRNMVDADQALKHHFTISKKGAYILKTIGLNKQFRHRLEDSEGWPLLPPGWTDQIERELAPGSYQYFSMPEPLESRRLVQLLEKTETKEIRGKGPHRLFINQPIDNIWIEDAQKNPDIYLADLSAPAPVSLELKNELEASIISKTDEIVCKTKQGHWEGELPSGKYRIEVRSIEKNNRLPYSILLSTNMLIPGITQTIHRAPSQLEVRLGEPSLCSISGFSDQDVKAELADKKSGALIAENDDVPGDWNFEIRKNLNAGEYILTVTSPGPEFNSCDVRMRVLPKQTVRQQELPFQIRRKISGEILEIPFITSQKEAMLKLTAESETAVHLSLSKNERLIAEGEGRLYIPLPGESRYKIQIWTERGASGDISLDASAIPSKELTLGNNPVSLPASQSIRLINPQNLSCCFRGFKDSILYSQALESPCRPAEEFPMGTDSGSGWIVNLNPKPAVITPLHLDRDQSLPLRLDETPQVFTLKIQDEIPRLLELESADALIGMNVTDAPDSLKDSFPWNGIWMENSRTLTGIASAGSYTGKIWATRSVPPMETPAESFEGVLLRIASYPIQGRKNLAVNASCEDEIQPGHSCLIQAEQSVQNAIVSFSRNMAAFTWKGMRCGEIITAAEESGSFLLSVSDSSRIIIVNRGEEAGLFRIQSLQAPLPGEITLDKETGFDDTLPHSGLIRCHITADNQSRGIAVIGSVSRGRFLMKNGRVIEGETKSGLPNSFFYPPGEGVLEIRHTPGPLKIWFSKQEDFPGSFIGNEQAAVPSRLLEDQGKMENRPQTWKLNNETPSLVSVSVSSPSAVALLDRQKVLDIKTGVNAPPQRLIHLLPKGEFRIWTRPFGRFQEGAVRIKKTIPKAWEQNMKNMLIIPGELQAFRFSVRSKSHVGVGLKTESDEIRGWLYNPKFQLLATGPLIIEELDPGDYLLVVEGGEKPVRFRPMIIGNEGSRTREPDDIMEEYKAKEGIR